MNCSNINNVVRIFSFRSLKLFQPWSDNALRSICFEAQIQEVYIRRTSVDIQRVFLASPLPGCF